MYTGEFCIPYTHLPPMLICCLTVVNIKTRMSALIQSVEFIQIYAVIQALIYVHVCACVLTLCNFIICVAS